MKTLSFIFTIFFLAFFISRCSDNKKNNNSDTEKTHKNANAENIDVSMVELEITKINEQVANIDSPHQVIKKEVIVEGIITANSNINICILLHPMTTRTWYVQNPATVQKRNDGKPWKWEALIYCGTDTQGIGDRFKIVAYGDSGGKVCSAGQFEVGQEPSGVPMSDQYTILRKK